jgi:RNA polymerase sigma-70 factor, ECF subfamily
MNRSTNREHESDPAVHWRPFVDGLRAFVARRVPERDAEDVAQDVMVRLHRAAGSLRDSGRAESWVYGIARRTIADYYRSRGPGPAAESLADPEELTATGDEPRQGFGTFAGVHSVHEEVLSWLRPMAEELPAHYRDALLLADFEGRPQQEVADALSLSLSGAKSRIQRARALLGEHLRRCCEVELGPDGRVTDFRRRACDC